MTSLVHYTLNTGDWIDSPLSQVDPEVLNVLRPMAKSGCYTIPTWGDLSVIVSVEAESADFTISTKTRLPVLTAGLAWTAAGQQHIARQLMRLNAVTGSRLTKSQSLPVPSTVPWLGIVLFDAIALMGERVAAFGDFERCLAWAILLPQVRPMQNEDPRS